MVAAAQGTTGAGKCASGDSYCGGEVKQPLLGQHAKQGLHQPSTPPTPQRLQHIRQESSKAQPRVC
jgi:hypothetical protein